MEQNSGWPVELPRSGRDGITLATGTLDLSVFREYDIRGVVNFILPVADGLNEFSVDRIGRAFGTALAARGVDDVAVGFDSRSYSQPLANALVAGLLSTGRHVTMIGMATTPMVYFAQHHLKIDGAVSVTASHNPNGWAGLKLSFAPSTTLGPAEIDQVRAIAISRDFVKGTGSYSEISVTDDYVSYLSNALPAPAGLRVVVDGGNSVSGPIAESTLRRAGYDVVSINRELDWTFPSHEPDPETLSARLQIQKAVLAEDAFCGISLDGDGDRLGITDGSGNIVWSDSILAILAQDILARKPGASIVYDVKCSRAVEDVVTASGGVPTMWMTGHSLIKSKMREIDSPFAGERSGHFFNALDYYGFDDAVYSALWFLSVVARRAQPLSATVAELPQYEGTPTMQAACADDKKYDAVDQFAEYAKRIGARELVRINGVRAEFDDGWLLVRASSNMPALVLLAEAVSKERLRTLYGFLREGLSSCGDVERVWLNDPFAAE